MHDTEHVARIEAALDAIEARGARTYDAPACDCVRSLLEHAEKLGGLTSERLLTRADEHLSALRERFERDHQRLASSLESTERVHGELTVLRQRLGRGELSTLGRSLRRLRLRVPARRVALQSAGQGQPARPGAERRKSASTYEHSVAQLVATLALARATDMVPSDAGPYNPLRIASDLLDRMQTLSPHYLTVQLNRLEELSSLMNLPELPTKAVEPARAKAKSGKKTKR